MQEGLGHNRYDDGSCDGEGQCRYFNSVIWFLTFYFWSFSLCNFVDPPRAALRGICPNRSHFVQYWIEKKTSSHHLRVRTLVFCWIRILVLRWILSLVFPWIQIFIFPRIWIFVFCWILSFFFCWTLTLVFCGIHLFVRYHIAGIHQRPKSTTRKRKRNCKFSGCFTWSGMLMNSSLWFGRPAWACHTIKDSQGEVKSGQFGDH